MRKLTILFALLTLSVGLWAIDNVAYIDANGQPKTANGVNEITFSSTTLAAGWYVVKGVNVRTGTLVCQGAVNIILADGAKLTARGELLAQAGIQVSGEGNSLTIYGQVNQTGELIANGGRNAAGIGGGYNQSGSNITINGGIVTATGGESIGGGAAGIGGGYMGNSSNIFVATSLIVKADNNNPPTTVIENTGTDLASSLAGKQYVTIEPKPALVSTTYIDENGATQTVDAWEVKDASEAVTWGKAGETTWFVVNGTNVTLAKGAICAGNIRLILADNAKLTATGAEETPGIQVSGEGNSLTIYGQTAQTGELIANGETYAAGIGGGYNQSDSNITINGGKVTATGGDYAAGIGGGYNGSGSNITINGGEVIATGGKDHNEQRISSGLGDSYEAADSLQVATSLTIFADNTNPPTTEIPHTTGWNVANYLAGRKYVIVKEMVSDVKKNAILAVNEAIAEGDNDNVKAIATNAAIAINAATSVEMIDAIKSQALENIASAKAAYNDGDAAGYARGKAEGIEEGKAEALGEMATPCTDCTAVEVTDGTTTVTLYNPTNVGYIKITE